MIILGLTGSIGMGKSTTAQLFAGLGVPVHDSDAAVHQLYAGKAAPLIEAAFPGATRDGAVDRGLLSAQVIGNQSALKTLGSIIHPLVRADAAAFVQNAAQHGARLVVFDIPLLFETGGESRVDAVIVVSADPATQRKRVLARPGMTAEKFSALLANQMPDSEKRRRAHFIVDTGHGLDSARDQVRAILRAASFMAGRFAGRPIQDS